MRIRSIKPEFWRDESIVAVSWVIVYDGPLPKRVNAVAPMRTGIEYVYMLFDSEDCLLYVGRSFRPADRFTKHRRKPWWGDVLAAVIVAVHDDPVSGIYRKHYTPPNVSAFELTAIAELDPLHNIARPKVA